MKRFAFAVVAVVVAAVGAVVAVVGYGIASFPPKYLDIPAPDLAASTDPEVIAQGEYLFHAVAHCTICHTPADEFIGKDDVSGAVPRGGHEWQLGPIGTLRSANITSDVETGIGGKSDGDLARVLRTGIKPDGEPAWLMISVGPMADEDIVALISYLRTIPPVRNPVPPSEISWFGKLMIPAVYSGFAAPAAYSVVPQRVAPGTTSAARGEYLANGPAYCFACHSDRRVSPVMDALEPRFAGCVTPDPDPGDEAMELCAPNLTPDPRTGVIADWSEDEFVDRFRSGRSVDSSPMPWENYRLMTDGDLRSIYRYLSSLPPTSRVTGPGHREASWAAR